jgi:ribosomal protein S18 acetylase RimI-like enzyme
LPAVLIIRDRFDPAAVERLLRSLPEWFGIEQAIRDYVRDAQTMPTYLAMLADEQPEHPQPIAAMLATRHFPESAEIHLMAVAPGHHRRGIGRALLRELERDLVAEGVGMLQVKTLGPSHPDRHYALTRAFYTAMGFLPLQELPNIWPGNPCLIMVKPLAAFATM